MKGKATARGVRMSPRKMRILVDEIRGKGVNDAYAILQFSTKAASEPIDKVLRSAVANAVYEADERGEVLDVDELVISEAYVNEGSTLRRWRARAFGRATPIRKRSSHVTVVVDTKE